MVTKGSDDVIAAERAYLSQIMPTLKAETSEIYLMSFNMDWGSTPKKYIVDGSTGQYSESGTTGIGDVETSKYMDELGAIWASENNIKLMRYSSCYVEFREAGNSVSANVLKLMQGCLLYNSLFNKEVSSNSTYHKTISSSYSDGTATKVRNHTVAYSTYVEA